MTLSEVPGEKHLIRLRRRTKKNLPDAIRHRKKQRLADGKG